MPELGDCVQCAFLRCSETGTTSSYGVSRTWYCTDSSPTDTWDVTAMKKPAGAAQSSPDCSPPRRPLSIGNPESRCESAVPFPPEHRLIITTTKGVYTWDAQGVTQIFRSGSEGIVAATRVTSSSEMLAVADSQVVVLHEIGGGKKSYRLKGSEVRCSWLSHTAHC